MTQEPIVRKSLVAAIAAAAFVFGAGMLTAGASPGLPSQSPGDNFNMTVPPVVVVAPQPVVTPTTQAPVPVVQHTATYAATRLAPAPVPAPVTTTTTASAALPTCPTDGSTFPYGSCATPAGVLDTHGALPGAPAQIINPAGCGLMLAPEGFTPSLSTPGAYTCNPPVGQ